MFRLCTFVLAIAVVCAFGVTAFAADAPKEKGKFNVEDIFKRLDKNNDGVLVWDEVKESRMVTRNEKAEEVFKKNAKEGKMDLEGFKAFLKDLRGDRKPGGKRGPRGEKKTDA
jgi:hypothetical protein